MGEAARDADYCLANLLVDVHGGGILLASLTSSRFCGYTSKGLQAMNIVDLFGLSAVQILHSIKDLGHLKIISLDARFSSGKQFPVRAYVDYSPSDGSGTLFLSVFENLT
jgi:hypothetical protein